MVGLREPLLLTRLSVSPKPNSQSKENLTPAHLQTEVGQPSFQAGVLVRSPSFHRRTLVELFPAHLMVKTHTCGPARNPEWQVPDRGEQVKLTDTHLQTYAKGHNT